MNIVECGQEQFPTEIDGMEDKFCPYCTVLEKTAML
jgi:hypothetical protein